MTALAPDPRQKAVNYIKAYARPLEKALYAFYFEHGGLEPILIALSKFQNGDGGFGRGLEPDLRLADSSVIATTIAFQKFRALNIPPYHPMIQKAGQYLLNQYDPIQKTWSNIPSNIDDAPHAPWWNYSDDLSGNMVNPRAEILGYFYDYPTIFPSVLRDELTHLVMIHLETHTDVEMHDLLCYIRLAETANFPSDLREKLIAFLTPIVEKSVPRTPSQWGEYGLTPLTVVSTPQSLFYSHFANIIPHNIAYINAQQTDAGYWSPSWSWEFASATGWRDAERDLRGMITLNNLLYNQLFS